MNQRLNIKKYIIFLNGKNLITNTQVLSHNIKSTSIKKINNSILFAADGGLNYIIKNKIRYPKLIWVGDADSLNPTATKYLEKKLESNRNSNLNLKNPEIHILSLKKNKNYSDFAALLDHILQNSSDEKVFLEIFCGLGGRRDHENANILEAERFLTLLPNGGICYFHGGLILSSIEFEVLKIKNMSFSLFCKKEMAEVEIIGALYSGKFNLERPSHGLSNSASNSRILIRPSSSLISVYF
ncbi:hypothetical protein [Silvanigrella aquatica]|uniref:Thiamin pyrophosphokinase catalytic domain-containing protein n=1 Tax=Silvanigrella aquatica TaxID=1915309 RepID=A0A1L4CYY0_9BACT|nr:hypothetical protein [Silvanigrella aquatica]APJ03152.1 hypothetical protein AXG55_04225 [Silvanigrella aquatica]